MTRLLSGVVMASALLVLILYGTPEMFLIVIEALIVICMIEFYKMLESGGEPSMKTIGTLLGAGLCAVVYLKKPGFVTAYMALAVSFTFMAAMLPSLGGARVDFGNGNDSIRKVSNTLFGIVYIAITISTLALIRKEPTGQIDIITLILSNALCDTFAYYTGRRFGKTPLAPAISPKKTVEGFFGGVAGAMAGAFIVSALFPNKISLMDVVIIGMITGFVGPLGDLSESAVKRKCNVKDSGVIIPGHGGALDRVDSLMFSSAFFFIYQQLVMLS